jgi:hypothetical protein
VKLPFKAWRKLLAANAGREIRIEIAVCDASGRWTSFAPIRDRVAEPIDSHLVYRLIDPAYNLWKKMGIYQRNLETFEETPVLINRLTEDNCMNCHNFCKNSPDRWLMHLRGGPGTSMLLTIDGKTTKIDTKTAFNASPAAYPAWHPGGKIIAFSVNKLILFYHAVGESRDVLDLASDVLIYRIDDNTVTGSPRTSDPKRLETFPAWSPDGRYLYFCSAPEIDSFTSPGDNNETNLAYDQIRYDLKRIRYDAVRDVWGELETVLSSEKTGKSITMPRISPDGRFCLVTLANYGNFPIYYPDADVALIDLATGEWKRLESNSGRGETFHGWSSNGRWIVFSSKRQDGLLARPYFAHMDSLGTASKPFVLPQEDPRFYDSCLLTYNVPELVSGPIQTSPRRLVESAYGQTIKAKLDPRLVPGPKPAANETSPYATPQPQ